MKKTIHTVANILPTVLVIGTLMMLSVLGLLRLLDIEIITNHFSNDSRRKEAWLESAILLYEYDSLLLNKLDNDNRFVLFEDDTSSVVKLTRDNWGLYELIRVTADGQKFRKSCLTGYVSESPLRTALYVCDNNMALTVAGKSDLKGIVHLPKNGLIYGQVMSNFYSGDHLPQSQIRTSNEYFPDLDQDAISLIKTFLSVASGAETINGHDLRVSFFDTTVFVRTEGLTGTAFYGNIAVYSPDYVNIDSTCQLEDVLIVSPKVTIADGFSGTLQIIASDSVSVGSNVRLKYPSGIVIAEGQSDCLIKIGENSEINGYVILRTDSKTEQSKLTPNYLQSEGSHTRGLVWIDGISQIHGTVTGALYLNKANYYTEQGYYKNLLYNTSVYGATVMPYPLWMKSNYKRKTAKWLN